MLFRSPCSNHACKNVRKHLEELRKTVKALTQEHVAKLAYSTKHILNLHLPESECRRAILNCLNHVGGNHRHCSEEWKCKHAGKEGELPWDTATVNKVQVIS